MPTIHIMVRHRRAKSPTTHIVCGNKDYKVRFDFDAEWDAYDAKTARFIWNGWYEDVVFSGDTCAVPQINNAQVCEVGVFAGDLRTTTPAFVKCDKSILCGEGSPAQPSPDVYAQIMEALNSGNSGGFYIPQVSQPDAYTIRIAWMPSVSTMPKAETVYISLPRP